jgi:hypothetical protein
MSGKRHLNVAYQTYLDVTSWQGKELLYDALVAHDKQVLHYVGSVGTVAAVAPRSSAYHNLN